uniref:non-specific serine/threonine protein kinase n=1 Tax=Oryctolagus cuniculus TaxID=9986 RepID=G1TFS0_RABIT
MSFQLPNSSLAWPRFFVTLQGWVPPTMEGLTAFNSEEEVLDGYQVLKITGKGSFGQVALAHHLESGTQVAVKMIATGGQNSRRFQQFCAEAEIMKGLHHPHIIKLLQLRHTAQRGYIFMEYAIKGDLRCYLIERGCLQDEEIRPIFYQTLSAVHYCHEQRIVHRDLKLENLLLDDNLNIKLTDFGLSCKLADGEHLKCLRGTLHYCAPEEFRAEAFNGYKADVWSLGVVLYTMVTKSLPFEGKDFVHLKETILSAYYRIPSYVNIELENLLDRLLTRNPEERPTVADIMGHQWLRVGHKAPETSEETENSCSVVDAMTWIDSNPLEGRVKQTDRFPGFWKNSNLLHSQIFF